MSGAPGEALGAVFGTCTGRVESFDDHRGSGVVETDDGTQRWSFHCTRIADGSRSIAPDTPVAFEVVPGPVGLEAVQVRARG